MPSGAAVSCNEYGTESAEVIVHSYDVPQNTDNNNNSPQNYHQFIYIYTGISRNEANISCKIINIHTMPKSRSPSYFCYRQQINTLQAFFSDLRSQISGGLGQISICVSVYLCTVYLTRMKKVMRTTTFRVYLTILLLYLQKISLYEGSNFSFTGRVYKKFPQQQYPPGPLPLPLPFNPRIPSVLSINSRRYIHTAINNNMSSVPLEQYHLQSLYRKKVVEMNRRDDTCSFT